MDYKLSDKWQSQTLLSKSTTSTKGYYTYLYDFGGNPEITFSRYLTKQNANTQTTDVQQNFIGDFDVLGLRNRMVFGIDYLSATQTDNGTGYVYYGSVTPDGTEEAGYPLSTAGVDAALESANVNNVKSKYGIFSLYVSDVLNITQNLSAMVGLRLDRFDNEGSLANPNDDYDQTTFNVPTNLKQIVIIC
jgi:iron complex outermembrane receptor protein